jgi:V8-like Glu-specific endopeptidase
VNRVIALFILFFILAGCKSNQQEKVVSNEKYFDLQGFMEKEQGRLARLNLIIQKTVSVNGSSETRSMKITDWKKELAAFTDADINKAAWKGLFHKKKQNDWEIFTSDNEKVPVKALMVKLAGDKVVELKIHLQNTNPLYTSVDTLSYLPDRLYQIIKVQHIKLLKTKEYRITGKF